jgi:hypothetical protein
MSFGVHLRLFAFICVMISCLAWPALAHVNLGSRSARLLGREGEEFRFHPSEFPYFRNASASSRVAKSATVS